MSWVIPTPDQVTQVLPSVEVEQYRHWQGSDEGDEDTLPSIVTNAIAEFRGRVAACATNRLAGQGIPPECVHHFWAIVRYRLMSRVLGRPLDQQDPRAVEYRAANDFLKALAACEVGVTQGPAKPANPRAPKPSHRARPREFSRRQQDGL